MMRKLILIITLVVLVGCGVGVEDEIAQETTTIINELIFNTPEVEYRMNISPMPNDFFLPITDEQLSMIFPFLEVADVEWNWGQAEYQRDGTLVEVWLDMDLPADSIYRFEIRIGFGKPPMSLREYGFFDDEVFEYSDMHNVLVKAIMVDDGWSNSWRSFDATFVIDDVYYRIRFSDDEKRGKNRMTEMVNMLILNGTEGFAILENPDIPYMRAEFVPFDEAYLDPDFGAFIPTAIPEELAFYWGNRTIQEHRDENFLTLTWEIVHDEVYLYDIYTRWVEGRTADTPVYPFEHVFWGRNKLSWGVSEIEDWRLEQFVSATDFMQDDTLLDAWQPIFVSEELTFELIQRLEQTLNSLPQGADWEEYEYEENIFIPFERSQFYFGVLFDDILITILAEGNITPEIIWLMLEDLLE